MTVHLLLFGGTGKLFRLVFNRFTTGNYDFRSSATIQEQYPHSFVADDVICKKKKTHTFSVADTGLGSRQNNNVLLFRPLWISFSIQIDMSDVWRNAYALNKNRVIRFYTVHTARKAHR